MCIGCQWLCDKCVNQARLKNIVFYQMEINT